MKIGQGWSMWYIHNYTYFKIYRIYIYICECYIWIYVNTWYIYIYMNVKKCICFSKGYPFGNHGNGELEIMAPELSGVEPHYPALFVAARPACVGRCGRCETPFGEFQWRHHGNQPTLIKVQVWTWGKDLMLWHSWSMSWTCDNEFCKVIDWLVADKTERTPWSLKALETKRKWSRLSSVFLPI